jgi:hypothetical protein
MSSLLFPYRVSQKIRATPGQLAIERVSQNDIESIDEIVCRHLKADLQALEILNIMQERDVKQRIGPNLCDVPRCRTNLTVESEPSPESTLVVRGPRSE